VLAVFLIAKRMRFNQDPRLVTADIHFLFHGIS